MTLHTETSPSATVVPRGIRARGPQRVTFIELFFDLVFVFAVTQLTAMTAHDLTLEGVVRALVVGWLIWWAWTQLTWTLNPADTTHHLVRITTLAATGAAFVMAASVPRAFTDLAVWFALPYLVVRALGLGLQVLVELERTDVSHAAVFRWAVASLAGMALVLVGALVDPDIRTVVWVLAIAADFGAAALAGRESSWDLNTAHMAERHGLFVIIALGESLIVAGTAITESAVTVDLVLVVGAVVVVAGLLWWTYFGWLADALEHQFARTIPERLGPVARDAFSLAHFPLITGVVAFAVAVEAIVAHPDHVLDEAVQAALVAGVALFVASSAVALWRVGGPLLRFRLVALAIMAGVLTALVALPPLPILSLGIIAASLLVIVVRESVATGTGVEAG